MYSWAYESRWIVGESPYCQGWQDFADAACGRMADCRFRAARWRRGVSIGRRLRESSDALGIKISADDVEYIATVAVKDWENEYFAIQFQLLNPRGVRVPDYGAEQMQRARVGGGHRFATEHYSPKTGRQAVHSNRLLSLHWALQGRILFCRTL